MMGINAQRNGITVKNSILGEKNVTGQDEKQDRKGR